MIESSPKSGAKVSFRLGEAVCPDLQQILAQMTSSLEVSGKVVFFSDYGEKRNHFAIVDVDGVLSPLIVPVSRLQRVEDAATAEATSPERQSH